MSEFDIDSRYYFQGEHRLPLSNGSFLRARQQKHYLEFSGHGPDGERIGLFYLQKKKVVDVVRALQDLEASGRGSWSMPIDENTSPKLVLEVESGGWVKITQEPPGCFGGVTDKGEIARFGKYLEEKLQSMPELPKRASPSEPGKYF